LNYCYIYTGDKNKEERIKKALDYIKNLSEEVVFVVNDLQSIAYLKEKGYKALNIDAAIDLLNLMQNDDNVFLCTDEKDKQIIIASFRNVKEIC